MELRQGSCPKCNHNHVLHVAQVADYTDVGLWPLNIAIVPDPKVGWLGPTRTAMGEVQAYVCRRCGFTELYTRDAGSIPVDGKAVKEIVGPEPAPYR
jgi:predicted nucleic-acid-binding Zn-ribbon protein